MADIRQTVILDDFVRPAEFPLSNGGQWGQSDTVRFAPMSLFIQGGINHRISHPTSAEWPAGSGADRRFASSYWKTPFTTDNPDGFIEAWGRPTGGNASGLAWSIGLFQNPGGANAVDGYFFREEITTGGGRTVIYRYTNGTRTAITGSGPVLFTGAPAGAYFLFRLYADGDMEVWCSTDYGNNWTLLLTAHDTTYTGEFYTAFGVTDNSGSRLTGWGPVGGLPVFNLWVGMNWRYAERHLPGTRGLLNPSDVAYP